MSSRGHGAEKIEITKSARIQSVWLEGTHPRYLEVTASKNSIISARYDDFPLAHLIRALVAKVAKVLRSPPAHQAG